MSTNRAVRLRSPAIAAIAAFAIVGLLQVRAASAACGDWLDHGTGSSNESATADTEPGSRHDLSHLSGVPRCHGPACRQSEERPTRPVPAAPPTSTVKNAVCGGVTARIDDGPEHAERVPADSAQPSEGFPYRVEHPPRG